MPHVKEIIDLMEAPTKEDIELITKAYNFSEKAHAGQKRFSREPYFIHPFETARNLADLGKSAHTISAGLLHDCIEDANVKNEDLGKEFDKEILFLVEGVTKLGKIKYRGEKRHSESLRKLFVAMSEDIRVIIIKLADRLHNMETLQYVSKEKQERIASETLEIYAPIAYRLGIRKLNRELEDLAFPYVYPKEYDEVKKMINLKLKENTRPLKKFLRSIQKALAKESLTQVHTDYRTKGLYSLYKKLLRKGNDIEKIYDIYALRVVVPNINDCYKALGIIHGVWRPLPGRIKDYIAFPKTNGYKSIHTTVFTGDGKIVEVQIKTQEMQDEAEYGIASHIMYKDKLKKDPDNPGIAWIKRLLPFRGNFSKQDHSSGKDIPQWVKELVLYQSSEAGNENFTEDIKADFFQERILVFTPKGDVIDLPIGSSSIDFAYTVHSDIGDHMSGVKINGKLVSIDTTLRNGDIVEIQTKQSSHPSVKWLEFAKTTIAQRHIRSKLGEKKDKKY
ncbi:MAG: bifunctional (p)ppGpp synthetase/guanosine-3',5'-bis(diphosphate) 3'-pyrophosphohydrolase [Parcubacteria group bacterium]|nr:bifunctional (p)ppGpp synthetase/guanosine-3',5'-bis(diphosphate) 3'-pyrophosphohydrolase [Parcubacteria group bacterium]